MPRSTSSRLASAEFVMRANDGNQTVPTLLFPDGSTATNPSIIAVQSASRDAGQPVASQRRTRRREMVFRLVPASNSPDAT